MPVPFHRLDKNGDQRLQAFSAEPVRSFPQQKERFAQGLEQLGFLVRRGEPVRIGPSADAPARIIRTPIVPVLVGDDWKAALLWRELYDAGVFTNCAIHPAVPPGGALLRTSVMATHDAATLDRALDVFASVKRGFESEHGPLPSPADAA